MGKHRNSVVVLWIWLKFWCMIPMGVKYNHTKFEQETRRWRPGTGFASGGPQFQKLQFRAKNSHFWAKKCDSEGTYSTRNPPLFVVSTPQNCPNGRLDPNT